MRDTLCDLPLKQKICTSHSLIFLNFSALVPGSSFVVPGGRES